MGKKQTLYGIFILLAIGMILYSSKASDVVDSNTNNEQSLIAPSKPLPSLESLPSSKTLEIIKQNLVVNKKGETIEKRYNPPNDFTRVSAEKDSFAAFLRNQKLKPYGAQVLYYNGKSKNAEGIYDSVIE